MRNRKRKTKLEEIDKIKKQKLNVENTMSELQNEIKNETPVAEDYQNSTCLTKAASFHLNFFGGKIIKIAKNSWKSVKSKTFHEFGYCYPYLLYCYIFDVLLIYTSEPV